MAYIYDLTDTWNAGGTTFNAIKMNVTDSASAAGSKLVTLQTNGTEHFSVTKAGVGYFSGNVGIGTASPSSKLTVLNGDIEISTAAAGNTLLSFNGTTANLTVNSSSAPLVFGTSSTERMRITSAGNVGIGTSSPLSRLSVQQSADGFDQGFTLSRSGANRGTIFLNASDDTLNFGRATSTYMTLSSAGNVGIGVTPSASTEPLLQMQNGGMVAAAGPYAHFVANAFYGSGGWTYTASASATRYEQGVGIHSWHSAGSGTAGATVAFTERMRIDASGNVGIGTSSPQLKLVVSNSGAAGLEISPDALASSPLIQSYNRSGAAYTQLGYNALQHVWQTSGTERARIDTSGNLLWGKSSTANEVTTDGAILYKNASGGGSTAYFTNGGNGTAMAVGVQADASAIQFFRSGSSVGSISLTTTATAYNTSSDYRLKDIDGPITNSGAYIDALKPVQGSWKADGSRFIGLLAHEVQEVSETPIATGVKDGEEMQAMDYSAPEIIANLIAEIQSLRARVAQLEGN